MKKTIILIVLLLLVGIIYFKVSNVENPKTISKKTISTEEVSKESNFLEDTHLREDIYKYLLSKNKNGLVINIPETKVLAPLTSILNMDKYVILKGIYSDGSDGRVLFNHNKITFVSKINNNKNEVYYVAPFSLINQGTGRFEYIGLFKFEPTKKKNTHIDSYFLGDRIDGLSITDDIQAIKLKFLEHGLNQAMSEEPNKIKKLQLRINSNPIGFLKPDANN